MQSQPTFRDLRLLAGAHEFALVVLRHKLVGAAIACMGLVGLAGALVTFWPR
jgi:hypothetical protein